MFTSDQSLDLILRIVMLGPLALVWITLVVRLIGLRSFSKLIPVDFVVTIATGSLLANAATAGGWDKFVQACGAMAALLAAQALFTRLRRGKVPVGVLENRPVVLMRRGNFMEEAMAANRIAKSDVYAKLREANALDIGKVDAVVLETTGDISVLHGGTADAELFEGIETPSSLK